MKTMTRGNVVIEEIQVGDIHYEYDGPRCCKSEVITKPTLNGNSYTWQSKNLTSGEIIEYAINTTMPSHYSLKLYDYEAYIGCKLV
jgi:hypothetical protein